MKVYVIYDPLYEKVICVHQVPNIDCKHCKPIRQAREKDKDNYYFLEEIEKEVMEVGVKTYDSPAIITPTIDLKLETKIVQVQQHKEENICNADEEDQQEEMQFFNRNTGKMQKLFGVLNKVWTVCYRNHEVGDKGEAVYITLEAEDQEQAMNKAMQTQMFIAHIEMKYYNSKCLNAYESKGNYVIGKIDYYEGDPRL